MESEYFVLKSGVKIPVIGYGPGILRYKLNNSANRILNYPYRAYNKFVAIPSQKREYIKIIANALKVGFRLFDYSNTYGSLSIIKEAIDLSGVHRENLFITTRIGNGSQIKGEVRESFFTTLKKWDLDQIDLLQFHWPVTGKYLDTWKEMIQLKEEGYVKVLGVANCHQHHLELLETETGVLPEINQFEVHPLFTQKPLIKYCKGKGIQVEAYTPIARFDDRLIRLPLLKNLENKYKKNLVQIILRWHIQNGIIPIIRTRNLAHLKNNIDIFDFEISKEDMDLIDGINIDSRLRYHPDNCDFTIL